MTSFKIKKTKKNLEIADINYSKKGFIYKVKNENILEIEIFDSKIISSLIINNFNIKYKKILKIIILASSDSDSSTGNLMLALNELARLKSIMENKYYKFLKKQEALDIEKKIMLTEKDIKNNLIDIEIKKEEKEIVEEKHKSR